MFEESSLLVKALLILPIVFLALFFGMPELFSGDERRRKKTDDKDDELDKKKDKAEIKAAGHQGEINRLEKEKQEKLGNLKNEDPAAFHNRRKK